MQLIMLQSNLTRTATLETELTREVAIVRSNSLSREVAVMGRLPLEGAHLYSHSCQLSDP